MKPLDLPVLFSQVLSARFFMLTFRLLLMLRLLFPPLLLSVNKNVVIDPVDTISCSTTTNIAKNR